MPLNKSCENNSLADLTALTPNLAGHLETINVQRSLQSRGTTQPVHHHVTLTICFMFYLSPSSALQFIPVMGINEIFMQRIKMHVVWKEWFWWESYQICVLFLNVDFENILKKNNGVVHTKQITFE